MVRRDSEEAGHMAQLSVSLIPLGRGRRFRSSRPTRFGHVVRLGVAPIGESHAFCGGFGMIGWRTVFAAVVALVCAAACPAAAQNPPSNPRVALVVGEETYRDQALATTANDAGLVAQTLQAAGFDVVGARDLDGQSLRTALRDFLDKAAAAGPDLQAFVYLAGRGIQYNGDNYFVPIDAEIRRDADAPIEAVRVSDFVHALATLPGRARIVVLDAARANPYATQEAPLAPGLALVDPEAGVLIAFNAAPGTLAGDEQGPYGVFGKTLAGATRQGGVDVAEVFDQTRILVNQETQGALLPWSASELDGPYFIFERAADAPPPPVLSAAQTAGKPIATFPAQQAYAIALQRDTIAGYREFLAAFPNSDQARRVRAILAVRREAAFWRRTHDANSPRAYWTYLRVYPRGPHVADARRRLSILSAQYEPPPDFAPIEFEDLPPPPPDERFYEERPVYAFSDFGPPPPPPPVYYEYDEDDAWRDLPPPPPPPAVGVLPALEIAIPLFVGAVAYHHYDHRHDGIAPPRGPSPGVAPPPPAPPPLPANVRPVAPPSPRPVAFAPATVIVKPLPPIGPAPSGRGAQPGTGRPSPASASTPAQSNPPAPSVVGKPPVSPPPPAANLPATPQAVAPGGKPLPPAPSNAANPPANAPGRRASGKPARTAPSNAASPPANAPGAAPAGKPAPAASPNAANPPATRQPVPPGGKPAAPSSATNPHPNAPAAAPVGKTAPAPTNPPTSPPTASKPPAASAGSETTNALQPPPPPKPGGLPVGPRPTEVQKPAPQTSAAPMAHEPVPAIHAPAHVAPPPAVHAPAPTPAPAPAALAPATAHPVAPPPAPAVHPPAQPAPPPAARAAVPSRAPAPAALAPAQVHPPAAPAVHPAAQPGVQPPPKHGPQEVPKVGQPSG